MKNNALNIIFIVINSLEIGLLAVVSGVLACLTVLMFLFSGLDGAPDERMSSVLMIVFLAATIITAIMSLILNIICVRTRKKNQKTGIELPKGKWIASIAFGGANLVFLALLIVAFLLVLN